MKHLSPWLLLVLLAWVSPAHAQDGGAPVGWLKLSMDSPLRNRWSLYSEVETREGNAQLTGQQLGRLGLRLRVAPCVSLTAGYVLAANEGLVRYGPATPEHRLYQEIASADVAGPIRVGHRMRTEERWLRPTPEGAYRYAPRLRYQLRLLVPLHRGGALPVRSFYAVAADEVFAGLGARPGRSFLEENRASLGLGYRLSRRTAIELAYLYQSQARGPIEGQAATRNAVQVSLSVTAPSHQALVRK